MDVNELLSLISEAGVVGLLALFVIAMFKEWIVTGSRYRTLEKERAVWRELALRSTSLAEVATAQKEIRVFDDA